MDTHTSNLFRLVRAAFEKYRPLNGNELPAPWREASPAFPVRHLAYVAGGIDIAREDDDTPVRPLSIKLYLKLNNLLAPVRDRSEPWESAGQAKDRTQAVFGDYIPASDGDWSDLGDTVTEHYARQGLGAMRLERLQGDGQGDEVYVSDYEFMRRYPVRRGLLPYGGAVYLSGEGTLRRIRLHGVDLRPGDAGWRHAAFAYRTSALVWTVLAEHIGRCHLAYANNVLLATKRHLPLDHPLRSFIAPFHYRTAAINNSAALTLFPPGGMFHRASGFPWKTLVKVYRDCVELVRFEAFPDSLRNKGIHPDQLGADHARLCPYASDGFLFWTLVSRFVDDVFERSETLRKALAERPEVLTAWWNAQAAALSGGLPDLSENVLRAYLTEVIFTVTGLHQYVGPVGPYISIAGAKIWKGQEFANRQVSEQLGAVASLTGLPMPRLLHDFSHLMPDAGARAALQDFQTALRAMQTEIDRRNQDRRIPFVPFSPQRIACSVAI